MDEADLLPIWEAYRDGDPGRGILRARELLADEGGFGPLWFAYGCCLERDRCLVAADRAFHRAARARRDPVGLPWRVSWPRFVRLVDEAAADLPAPLRDALEEVGLVLADYADPVLLRESEDIELLGLFEGVPRAEGGHGEITPTIFVWRRAHEHVCGDAEELAHELRRTLYHELGHYLGYDEDHLHELGMG